MFLWFSIDDGDGLSVKSKRQVILKMINLTRFEIKIFLVNQTLRMTTTLLSISSSCQLYRGGISQSCNILTQLFGIGKAMSHLACQIISHSTISWVVFIIKLKTTKLFKTIYIFVE